MPDIGVGATRAASLPTKLPCPVYHGMIPPHDANGKANSEDPDQIAPLLQYKTMNDIDSF